MILYTTCACTLQSGEVLHYVLHFCTYAVVAKINTLFSRGMFRQHFRNVLRLQLFTTKYIWINLWRYLLFLCLLPLQGTGCIIFSGCQSKCPSFRPSVCPSFHPSICPSFHPSVCPPVHMNLINATTSEYMKGIHSNWVEVITMT